ncbi:MCE family protein [Mycolicibacter senuensis]|uniref:Putative Mce family protein n=1 Tax=Mycolicibacter senuensis TaxID=386913 RepID=A0A7I9XKF8_9MYCO|nr:MCE family protein [Mycolicibacter senuensis]ORW63636.1 mammalian cell entry protein [Mycolicibacter senuensis]GFG70445.1 putative Mce family protein [Mycolicibacter senuensis]
MRYRKALLGLSLFLVVSTTATWLVFVTLRREVTGPTNTYSAVFTDVSGLHSGDDVRTAGVRVGRVDSVELDGTLARVTFRIPKSYVLYDDTTAAVTYQNIIGQRYVGLSPGTAPSHSPLPDRGSIPVQQTTPSFDISGLLSGFEPLFTLLSPAQVDNLTGGIIQALQGDSASVVTLISQTSALAESLAGPDQVLGDVIANLDEVTGVLAQQDRELQAVIGHSRTALATLAARRDELVRSAGSITQATDRLSVLLNAVYPELDEFLAREPGFVGHLTGEGRQRFAHYGGNLVLVLKGLARATQSGSYIDGYICDINATVFAFLGRVIPGTVKLASPGNVVEHSPICR